MTIQGSAPGWGISVRDEILRLRLRREEQAIRRFLDISSAGGRRVLFPKARALADLMSSALPRKWLLRHTTRVVHRWRLPVGEASLSSFFSVSDVDHDDLDVVPRPEVCEALRESLILSDRYSVYFKAVVHENGIAVIYANVDQILGSRILAVVHSRSIPGFEE
jgi:hypothetical protein